MDSLKLAGVCPELEFHINEPLSRHTTFRTGGPADLMVFPSDESELSAVLRLCAETGEEPLILGNGSNVLAPDEGLRRTVIVTTKMDGITRDGNRLTAGAGCTMARFASAALNFGLTGMEFAHGIPGTIGGGAVMNAGAYGGELKDIVAEIRCLNRRGETVIRRGAELDFGYRRSCFDDGELIITAVTVELEPGDPEQIRARMEELSAKRRASQPLNFPSAGSTFKRPAGYFAGKLIQDSGLKGFTVGGAQVSEKHAGFVINTGNATSADVLAVIRHVRETVQKQFGVMLEPEVRILK